MIKIPKSYNKYNRYNDIIPCITILYLYKIKDAYNAVCLDDLLELKEETYINASYINVNKLII